MTRDSSQRHFYKISEFLIDKPTLCALKEMSIFCFSGDCDGFDASGCLRLHWLVRLLITCRVELLCLVVCIARQCQIVSSFVPGGCCVPRQMLMRAGVLSWIKPGKRLRSSLGSDVTMIKIGANILFCLSSRSMPHFKDQAPQLAQR